VVSTTPVPHARPHRRGSNLTRLVGVCAAMALAIVLILLLVLPTAAPAADPPLTRYDQNDEHLVYSGTWYLFGKTVAYGGGYARSSTQAASVTVYFNGTRLDWIGMEGTTTGLADVYPGPAPSWRRWT